VAFSLLYRTICFSPKSDFLPDFLNFYQKCCDAAGQASEADRAEEDLHELDDCPEQGVHLDG
jgi:hypothetical protein